MTKKIFAMFLAVLMVISLLPTTVFAANGCPVAGKHTKDNCDWTLVKVNAPTCGNVGYTTYQCNECDELFISDIVAATGEHTYVEVEAEAPTCEKTGFTAGLQCKDCGANKGRDVIPALYKDRKCEWKDITPNIDCTTGGQKWDKCAHCGAERKGTLLQPGQHAWDNENPKVVKEATASANGLAIVSCSECKLEKEVEIFASHDCVIVNVAKVDATCFENGMKAHRACRICGTIYNDNNNYAMSEKNIAKLTIPAAHAFVKMSDKAAAIAAIKAKDAAKLTELVGKCNPSCTDTVLYCVVCQKDLPAGVAHTFNYNAPMAGYVDPSCTDSGYYVFKCTTCQLEQDVVIADATGHNMVTVSVPATCGTFAYTLTYCTSSNCKINGAANTAVSEIYDDLYTPYTVGIEKYEAYTAFADVKARMDLGKGFYLALNQKNLGTPLYFTGEMDGYYLAASNDVAEAVVVYVEQLQYYRNYFNLYFYDANGVKTYIEIYELYAGKGAVQLSTTEPENPLTWDETADTFFCTIKSNAREYNTYYLGTYNTYGNFSVSNTSYITGSNAGNVDKSQFVGHLAKVGVKAGVQIIDVVFGEEYDFEKHMNEQKVTVIEPTCTEDGLKQITCTCGLMETEVVPAGCYDLVNASDDEVTAAGLKGKAYTAATCTAPAYQYKKCVACQKLYKEVVKGEPAKGHNMVVTGKVTADHLNPVGYSYVRCSDFDTCGFQVKSNQSVWKYQNYHFATEEQAASQHGHYMAEYDQNGEFLYYVTANGGKINTDREDSFTVKLGEGNIKRYYYADGHSIWDFVGYQSDLVFVKNLRAGTCVTYGLDAYKCTVCEKQVLVKTADKHGVTGQHIAPAATQELTATVDVEIEITATTFGAYFVTNLAEGAKLQLWVKGEDEALIKEIKDNTFVELEKGVTYIFKLAEGTMTTVELEQVAFYQAPTCEAAGWRVTYTCERCEKIIGNKAEGKVETIKAIGHNWLEGYNSIYMAAPCDAPDFDLDGDNWKYICANCMQTKGDGTKQLNDKDGAVCGKNAFIYYSCHCGEEHIRNYVDLEHKTYTKAPAEDPNYVKATCYSAGQYTVYCEYCDLAEITSSGFAAHVNAAKEKFTDKCTDTVTDRHCVECCKHFNHAAKGNSHDCYKTDKKGNFICAGECQIGKEHHVNEQGFTYYNSSCTTNPYGIGICADCDTHLNVYFEKDSEGNKIQQPTHKPVEADKVDGQYVKYANYTYVEDYEYVWYTIGENAKGEKVAVKHTETIALAKFIKYTAPTYSADGYAECVCTVCDNKVTTQVLNKLEGIGFYVEANAKEYTYGSMVEVTVSVDGYKALIHGFDFNVNYGYMAHKDVQCTAEECVNADHFEKVSDLLYVGYEVVDKEFMLVVSNAAAGMKNEFNVAIAGQASNSAEGKVRNIEVNEKVALVKLYFRVLANTKGEVKFNIEENTAYSFNAAATTEAERYVSVYGSKANGSAKLRKLGDFNNDGFAHITDLYQALALMTGELASGKTYDVTVDFDKDGVITVEDLLIGYDLYVGNVKDTFFLGMDAEEADLIIELLGLNAHRYECINKACSYGSDYTFIVCPVCYTAQNQAQ